MTDKRYDYWLNRLPGIGVQKRSILLADGRSAKDIFEMREEELLEIPFLMKQDVKRIAADRNTYDLKLSYEKLKSAGVDFITKEEKIFPARLGNIEGAPDALYVKGRLPVENVLSVAIVGARCCSEYGRAFAGEIAEALAAEGIQAAVTNAAGDKCQRCWKVLPTVNAEGLCPRCAQVIQSLV